MEKIQYCLARTSPAFHDHSLGREIQDLESSKYQNLLVHVPQHGKVNRSQIPEGADPPLVADGEAIQIGDARVTVPVLAWDSLHVGMCAPLRIDVQYETMFLVREQMEP